MEDQANRPERQRWETPLWVALRESILRSVQGGDRLLTEIQASYGECFTAAEVRDEVNRLAEWGLVEAWPQGESNFRIFPCLEEPLECRVDNAKNQESHA